MFKLFLSTQHFMHDRQHKRADSNIVCW